MEEGGPVGDLRPRCFIRFTAEVLDFCFFPSFTWEYPATCCFISSSQEGLKDAETSMGLHESSGFHAQDHPIHLRDAITGELRNTYRPFNHVDEVGRRLHWKWGLASK